MFLRVKGKLPANKTGCLTLLAILFINIALGGWAVNAILSWFGKNIPIFFDVLIGLFTGEFTIPIAIIGSILKHFGVF